MRLLFFIFFTSLTTTAFSQQSDLNFNAWEKKGGWGIYNKKPDSHFNPLNIKKYREGYLISFSYIIGLFEFKNVNNKYCLIGYKWNATKENKEHKSIIVFWENANYLIDWDLPDEKMENRYKAIIFSKLFIDINESVVPYKEIGRGQILWAKEGVVQVIEDCGRYGQKITIKPSEVLNIE
ncbi:hypothetical protein Xmau_01507 [Xenorhabdus mauleonii]|uniref:Uncharacterized protein n=1 Tax=Xenorhabdus mauleonii TaxID=351675 RepID=A0A1I3PJC0_9GAMM|nr:hypothetical protein [Xenorhabdus mauleonii]PHM44793.1 hypothetical protein Xmau_01507 [Xenorhabdus mauleonii]SFJ21126.1 hypothetical protein SAMN05421680_106154 [Xenorhabdus mauleonii]